MPSTGVLDTAKTASQTTASAGLTEVARQYQTLLERDPQRADALVGMSLVALASRQVEAAVKMATAATVAAPRMGAAWVALGQALKAAGCYEDAEQAYAQAIPFDGTLSRLGLGELRIAMGRAGDAAAEFRRALKRRPALVPAMLGLGNALAMQNRNHEALERYDATLAIRPHLPEAEFAAGFVLERMGRANDAEIRYRRALAARPDFAAAWVNLGSLLREQGRELAAESALQRAAQLRPDLASAWVNLALLERERDKDDRAEGYLRRAFALKPDQAETLVAWSQFRAAQYDLAGASSWLRWALAVHPEFDEAVNMHGILLHKEARFEEAVVQFERAEKLGNRAAASNRGNSLLDLGRMGEALKAQESAVQSDPLSAGARYNLALTQLRLGNWNHGWKNYEARWRFRDVHRVPREFKQPRWRGEALNGRRILLHAEQGLGDTIQFCRYAALVAARGGAPVVQVQAPVERLMRSLAVVRAGLAETAVLGREPRDFAWECPLMSLPAVFQTTIETVPWTGAYLGAAPQDDAETIAADEAQLRDKSNNLHIGLAWAGNPRYKADSARSMRLQTQLPLVRAVDAIWISLQKGDAAKQLARLPADVAILDLSSRDRDLADTAATIAGLDLVITTDTCIAHLAGAMEKPVWILLPSLSDWRWMQETETTPWYPTARLFRQTAPGDWAGVLQRVSQALTEWVSFAQP
jgi:tetratricopeptide (TPR) repeat protein